MRHLSLLATAALMLTGAAAHAATFSFTTIDNPGDPTFNQLLGINNAGTISGYFGSGAAGHPNQGYTIAAPYTTFVPDNLPGSVQTQATGINKAGATSGFWSPTNTGSDANFGFIRWNNHGHYTYLSVNNPLVASSPPVNQLLGINNGNIAVGFYNDANNLPRGYVYTVSTGQFTPVTIHMNDPNAVTGINNLNLMCGFYVSHTGRTLGFEKPLNGGAAISFAVPGAMVTQLLGVNNSGKSAGFFVGKDNLPHGVLYNPANGTWQQIDDPNGAGGTVVNGLNDKNQLVGFYTDVGGNVHGMLVTVSP